MPARSFIRQLRENPRSDRQRIPWRRRRFQSIGAGRNGSRDRSSAHLGPVVIRPGRRRNSGRDFAPRIASHHGANGRSLHRADSPRLASSASLTSTATVGCAVFAEVNKVEQPRVAVQPTGPSNPYPSFITSLEEFANWFCGGPTLYAFLGAFKFSATG